MRCDAIRNWLCVWMAALATTKVVVSAFPKRIPIGAVFDESESQKQLAFRYEIEKFNNRTTSLFKLDKYEKVIDTTDTFQLTKAICSTLSKGVFVIVGSVHRGSLRAIDSFSRTFNIPYISISDPAADGILQRGSEEGSEYILHLVPGFHRTILDVARHYHWTTIFYIYDSDEGLSRLEQMHLLLSRGGLSLEIEAMRISDATDCYASLRQIDARGPKDNKRIILDLSSEQVLLAILNQIQNVGMHRNGYHYVIGGLEMDDLDLDAFRYGGVNFTGFRVQFPDIMLLESIRRDWSRASPSYFQGESKLKLGAFLAIDAVTALVKGLTSMLNEDPDVFRGTFRRGQLYNADARGIQCRASPVLPWKHGPAIARHLRQVRFEGLTGPVLFNDQGDRSHFILDVIETGFNTRPRKMGEWNETNGLTICRDNTTNIEGTRTNHTSLIITTILSSPYLMIRKVPDDKNLTGNDRYEGYAAELSQKIGEIVGFKYILQLVKDGKYGAKNEDGSWNGMVGELTDRVADLAIAPLTISSVRERVIDFSKPFMNLGISIMIHKPEKQKPGVFSFMDPLHYQIWVCVILSYMAVSLILFLVNRFSPYGWRVEEGDARWGPSFVNDFSLLNSMWFSLSALLQQGCDISPRSVSGRVAGSAWWFFTLIIISTYTANLAAFLTVERMLTPINSASDLAKQTQIQYGTLDAGSTKEFFKMSRMLTYEKMWNYMNANPGVFEKTTDEGVQRVRSSKGKYAFLLESTMNDYYNQRKPCNTMKVGENLDFKGYGVATPLDSELREQIGLAVLQLRENGELQKLAKKWWIDKGECPAESDGKSGSSVQNALTLSNVAGVFYILVSGLLLSLGVSFFEYICRSRLEADQRKKTVANFLHFKSRQLIPTTEMVGEYTNQGCSRM